jgi:mannose-6-phosphate isomerase-like protein (cupin superfamily)
MQYEPFHGDIERLTLDNPYYRHVIHTTPNMQLVLMSLKPRQDIGMEVHPYITQFFRVESGVGTAIINGVHHELRNGVVVVIPLGAQHNIINTSNIQDLKMYTIYSPPNHQANRLDVVKPLND